MKKLMILISLICISNFCFSQTFQPSPSPSLITSFRANNTYNFMYDTGFHRVSVYRSGFQFDTLASYCLGLWKNDTSLYNTINGWGLPQVLNAYSSAQSSMELTDGVRGGIAFNVSPGYSYEYVFNVDGSSSTVSDSILLFKNVNTLFSINSGGINSSSLPITINAITQPIVENIGGKKVDSSNSTGDYKYGTINGSTSGNLNFIQHWNDTANITGSGVLEAKKLLLTDNGSNTGGSYMEVWQTRGKTDSVSFDENGNIHAHSLTLTGGYVTSVSATGVPGFSLTVTNPNSTPIFTPSFAATGIYKSSGTGGISTAIPGTDYVTPTGAGTGLTGITYSVIGTTGQVTVSGFPISTVSLTNVNSSPGAIGCASCAFTGTVNATGQFTSVATVAASLNSSQINNLQTGLWTTSGNAITTVGIIGSTTNYPVAIHVNTVTADSIAASGTSYFFANETPVMVTDVSRTHAINIGVGTGGCYGAGTPVISWGTPGGCSNPQITAQGFVFWSALSFFYNTSTPLDLQGCAPNATGGNSFEMTPREGVTYNGSGVINGLAVTNQYTFSPTSGTNAWNSINDQGVYSTSGSYTGIINSYSNTGINLISAPNYHCFNATNSIGYGYYASSVTPTYMGGTTALGSKIITYNGINTVAGGVPAIYGGNDLTGLTAPTTIVTYSTTATATFEVGVYVTVTAVVGSVLQTQVTWTDETSTLRTQIFYTMGTSPVAGLSATGIAGYAPTYIRALANTNIAVTTTLTTSGVSITYDAGARIKQE